MSLDTQSYLRAAYPLARSTGQKLPRIFCLHWDNHKVASKRRDKDDWHQCWGTLYPDDGGVTLQYGMFYRNMGELRAAYEAMGSYRIVFEDEKEKEA